VKPLPGGTASLCTAISLVVRMPGQRREVHSRSDQEHLTAPLLALLVGSANSNCSWKLDLGI
jgi:hypothetical protein